MPDGLSLELILSSAADGLFVENVLLSRNNTLVVEARNGEDKKVIFRSFEVPYRILESI